MLKKTALAVRLSWNSKKFLLQLHFQTCFICAF